VTSPLPPFGSVEKCPACGNPRRIDDGHGVSVYAPFSVKFRSVAIPDSMSLHTYHAEGSLQITCPGCGYFWQEATVTPPEEL